MIQGQPIGASVENKPKILKVALLRKYGLNHNHLIGVGKIQH